MLLFNRRIIQEYSSEKKKIINAKKIKHKPLCSAQMFKETISFIGTKVPQNEGRMAFSIHCFVAL